MPRQVWEVIGGGETGGILVKKGKKTSSDKYADRLSTGARVEEIEKEGDRLHYQRLTGSGPKEGWVSIEIVKDREVKELLRRCEDAPAAPSKPAAPAKASAKAKSGYAPAPPEPEIPSTAPRCLRPMNKVAADLVPCDFAPPFVKIMQKKKLLEACAKRCDGDMYGLKFPQTPEELVDDSKFGCKWLTKAFQMAGTLDEDNSVKRIVTWRRFEGGGSGPKGKFEVEYEKPDESLDTVLFVKMPHPIWENEQQRFIEEGQGKFGDNWGGEINFYRWLSPHIPFPGPKYYFGDLSRESTEAILINACVEWPEAGKTDFGPYEVFPPCEKCEDYTLTCPQDYYFAVMRRCGTFAGLAKADRLGDDLKNIKWHPTDIKTDVNALPGFPGTENSVRIFVEQVAPHWWTEPVKKKSFLDKFVKEFYAVQQGHKQLAEYIYADPKYVALHHQNGNTDNVYFYKREDGTIDAGVLDWGSTAPMAISSGLMGSTISGLAEMLAEYDEDLVRCWVDSYHAAGGPPIEYEQLLKRYRISTCISSYGIFNSANQYASPQAINGSTEWFKTLPAWNCDAIRANFGMKFQFSMFYNRVTLFALKGDVYWKAAQEVLKK